MTLHGRLYFYIKNTAKPAYYQSDSIKKVIEFHVLYEALLRNILHVCKSHTPTMRLRFF